ncbi:RluA family pseudouridine synthase [candidate division KSB1 bacterium]|nr:RluA family pseudouridine synthase [candidate division KSB1 bacterium]
MRTEPTFPSQIPFQIIFEDETLIVVDKPSSLLTIPDHWDSSRVNLWQWLQQLRPTEQIFVVHRLDAETSGLILFSKSAASHQHICQQFETHQVQKIYFGIVTGTLSPEAGTITAPLLANPKKAGTTIVSARGKKAETHWEVLEKFRGFTYVKISPTTGRMHQIRVHFSFIGHPLVGDAKYGPGAGIYLSQLKKNYLQKAAAPERPLLNRLALHAGELTLQHPVHGVTLNLTSELPKDLRLTLKNFKRYESILKR